MKFTLLTFIHLVSVCQAQTTFQKTFGGPFADGSSSVRQTADGGFIIAGGTTSFGAGSWDVYLIRTAPNGDSLWAKTFGGTNFDYGNSVQQTADGGFIVQGSTASFGAGVTDFYLIRTDANGDSLWTKTFGGIFDDYGFSVQQTADGGFIISGNSASYGAGGTDVYLIKTDANGDSLWTKTFGGTDDDDGNSVQQTADSGFIIAGTTLSFGAGAEDIYLIRTDANGDTVWTKTFGGTNDDNGNSVQQTADGGFIITGLTSSFGAGNADVYLIRTDANGDTVWTKTFGGTNSNYGKSVQQTADGGIIIAGTTDTTGSGLTDVYIIRADTNGIPLWSKTYGGTGSDVGSSVQQTSDGGFIITGRTPSFGAGAADVYLIKINSMGNSHCNEGNPATIVTAPATAINSPATKVSSGGMVGGPATQTGSGGVVTSLCLFIGIESEIFNPQSSITIFPNPAINHLTIALGSSNKKVEATIADIAGKIIYTTSATEVQQIEMNTIDFAEGVYVLRIQTEDLIETKLLVVAK